VVSGVLPDGSSAEVDTANGRVSLLFLTSECRECKAAWRRALAGSAGTVIVTPGPETESSRRVAKLSEGLPGRLSERLSGGSSDTLSSGLSGGLPGGPTPEGAIRVVMSSSAWYAYGVTKAPWSVEIEAGTIVRTGPFVALPA
jgi:hypothetical protein